MELVKWLVTECKTNPDQADKYGVTSLQTASYHGFLEIVKWLVVECKANPNLPNANGDTSLALACDRGHLEVAKLLLTDAKYLSFVNDEGYSPFKRVCKRGHLELVKWMVNECGVRPPLLDNARPEVAKWLAERKPNNNDLPSLE